MSDPRREHRLMLETLERVRLLLSSASKMRRIDRVPGRADTLRAEVADILDAYDASLDEEAVRTLRQSIPGRLRRVYPDLKLPDLPAGVGEQIALRGDRQPPFAASSNTYRIINGLRGLLGAAATAPATHPAPAGSQETEVIYPRVRGPRRAEIEAEFSVEATYDLTPGDAEQSMTAPVVDDAVTLTVLAEATGGIELVSPPKQTLLAPAGARPGGITFRCRATRQGTGQMHLTFRAGGAECTLTHTIGVFARGALSAPQREAFDARGGRLPRGLPPPDLTLVARPLGDGLDVQLSDASGEVFSDGIAPLDARAAEALRRWVLDGWRLSGQQPSATRELQLGVIGSNLARSMLPPSVLGGLASQPAGHLRVTCDDPALPWEMLRIAGPDAPPLAESAAVARFPRRGRWGRAPRPGEVVLVNAKAHDAGAERQALSALGLGAVSVVGTVAEFVERQSSAAPIGVLHFACHGDARLDEPGSHALALNDGDLIPAVILRDADASPLAGALVFINACRAAHGDRTPPGMIGHHAWAEAFLDAGAACVIAPVCNVADAEASAFAVAVYRALREGLFVAKAVQRARQERAAAAPGSFERLAYVVYAPPGIRIGQHREAGRAHPMSPA